MTHNTRSVLRHALAVVALTASAGWGAAALAAPAADMPPARHAGMHAGHAMVPLSERGLSRMLDKVGASDEQRAQAEQIAAQARADLAGQRDGAKALHQQAAQLFSEPTVDADAAEALRQQMLDQHDRRSQRMMQATLDLSRVLTAEQRQLWVAEMQSARAHHPHRQGQRDPGAHRGNHQPADATSS